MGILAATAALVNFKARAFQETTIFGM